MRAALAFATITLAAAAFLAADPPQKPGLGDVTLAASTGQGFMLKDVLGTSTVLNFWAAWCGPCRQELPELQKLSNELGGKGLVVLAIAVDTPKMQVKPFMERMGLSLPVYFMDAQTQAMLGVSQIPLSVLLDRDGSVVQVYSGYAPAYMEDIRSRVVKALADRPKGGKS